MNTDTRTEKLYSLPNRTAGNQRILNRTKLAGLALTFLFALAFAHNPGG